VQCNSPVDVVVPSASVPTPRERSKLPNGQVSQDPGRQWRAARDAILLMGDSGLRRAEGAQSRREDLRPSDVASESKPARTRKAADAANTGPVARARAVWTFSVVGMRRQQRTVPVSRPTVEALRAYWADRRLEFEADIAGPLIAPTWIPGTDAAQNRHATNEAHQPYTPDPLGRLVRTAVQRLVIALRSDPAALSELSIEDLVQLVHTSAHAFRHTFGTRAVAREMSTDVVQAILGHASLQTTSIYVKAEKRRILDAAARYYADDV
jgi:integrase